MSPDAASRGCGAPVRSLEPSESLDRLGLKLAQEKRPVPDLVIDRVLQPSAIEFLTCGFNSGEARDADLPTQAKTVEDGS